MKGKIVNNSGNINFRCLYTNIRSILNNHKREELGMLLNEHKVNILGISESWANENIDDAELSFSGFSVFRRDRSLGEKKRGGGVLLYVRDNLVAVDVSDKGSGKSESIWVNICGSNGLKLTIGVCYLSPNPSMDEIDNLCKDLVLFASNNLVVMGDFNQNDINWDVLQAGSAMGNFFLKAINDGFLTQHVMGATRGNAILDLILSTEPELVDDVCIISPVANSDHNVLLFNIVWETGKITREQKLFNYHKGNYIEIDRVLKRIDWNESCKNTGVTEKWEYLLETALKCRDVYIPIKVPYNKSTDPIWLKPKIIKAIRKRKSKWNKLQHFPTYEREAKYRKYRNIVTAMIRKSKHNHELNIANKIKSDSKSFYAYVRNRSKARIKVGPLKNQDGELISDSAGMASLLNKYFASVFNKDQVMMNQLCVSSSQCGDTAVLDVIVFDEIKISAVIKKLQDNKTPGVDELNSTFIKRSMEGLLQPLVIIFNDSMTSGVIPEVWKLANVTPLFKKGKKCEAGNYRPVSLTSQICKIMERVIKDELVAFLESNCLINNSQHGFRKNRSCLTNLLEYMQSVSEIVDVGAPVDVIYLDFQKAFDKVPHNLLILKLEMIGIRGKLLSWVGEWLRDRKQRVVLNGEYSEWEVVLSGVPQGSVLGPVLFAIYINDIDEGLGNRILKFADDTKLWGRVGTESEIACLQADLDKLVTWSVEWGMSFNVEKCKIMHLGSRNNKEDLFISGKALVEVEVEKDLGVVMTHDFKVGLQCSTVAKKCFQILGMINRTFTCKSKIILIPLFKSLIRPHLDYCVQVWRPHLQKDIDVLERVQRRATRMICECKDREYIDRLKVCNLTTLETRRIRADLIEVYKIINKLEGINERDFFGRNKSRDTRGNSIKLFKKGFRLDIAKYNFGNRVVNEWNELPDCVILASSLNVFKGRLDQFLRNIRGLV